MAYQRFLVCESDELVQQSIREVVALSGHEVLAAANARETLDALTQGGIACAFVDIDRLDSNAFEIPQGLPVLSPRPRLVAMTARGSARDYQLAKDAGFDVCLSKPLSKSALVVALAQLRLQPWVKRPPWKTYRNKTT